MNKEIINIINTTLNELGVESIEQNVNISQNNILGDKKSIEIIFHKKESIKIKFRIYDGDLIIDIGDAWELFDYDYNYIIENKDEIKKIIKMILCSQILYQNIFKNSIRIYFIRGDIVEKYTYIRSFIDILFCMKTKEKIYKPFCLLSSK